MTIKLNLIQDLCYLDLGIKEGNLEKAYEIALKTMLTRGPGFEVCIKCSYSTEDLVSFLVQAVGYSKEPDEKIRLAVENLEKLDRPADTAFVIPQGTFFLCQMPYLPDSRDLFSQIVRVIQKTKGDIFLRLIKENMVEIVVQTLEGQL